MGLLEPLYTWSSLDSWIVITAALAAMACALPGVYLVLQRQSMMGDALSHAVLPGIAGAFLMTHGLRSWGVISDAAYPLVWQASMFGGAILIGVLTAVLTEGVRRVGNVEGSAALGVVFTSLFALGLLMIRLAADHVHLDADCVLYGTIETVVLDTLGATGIPRAALVNGIILLLNCLLVLLFYKELRICIFDSELATTQGIPAAAVQYILLAITATTLVAAFESVGSILVIAMLIVPAATASMLTHRLHWLLLLSLLIAAASAVLGHVAAIVLPPAIFHPLGFPTVVDASTAGMMAVAAGGLFIAAVAFAPEQGLLTRAWRLARLRVRVAEEDLLGSLYRAEEHTQWPDKSETPGLDLSGWISRIASWNLLRRNELSNSPQGLALTDLGRKRAREVVRSHRLWETYLGRYLGLSDARQHKSAHALEHFIGAELREQIAEELESPQIDPQGRHIPPAADE